jgi:hypothetical protein
MAELLEGTVGTILSRLTENVYCVGRLAVGDAI